MNPYDTRAVRAVWERVNACHEQLLSSMIEAEQQARDSYLRLSRNRIPYAKDFAAMAKEEAEHLRQLSRLYEQLYGKEAQSKASDSKTYANLQAAMTDRLAQEEQTAQSYRSAAGHFAAYKELFESLAQEELQHAQTLRHLLQHRLPPRQNGAAKGK